MGQSPQLKVEKKKNELTFYAASKELVDGKKVRRLEWPNDGTYIVLDNELLKIFLPADKKLHPLTVSLGDIIGIDWVII